MKKKVVSISEYRKKHNQKVIKKNPDYIKESKVDEFVEGLIFECNKKLEEILNKK